MKASDNQLLHDGIERIFAPLGARLRWIAASSSCKFGVWRLFSKQDPSGIIVLETSDRVNILGYRKLETLRHKFCSEISKIWIDRHCVANPFFGAENLCNAKSKEEAFIQIDLAFPGDNSKRVHKYVARKDAERRADDKERCMA